MLECLNSAEREQLVDNGGKVNRKILLGSKTSKGKVPPLNFMLPFIFPVCNLESLLQYLQYCDPIRHPNVFVGTVGSVQESKNTV